MSVPRTRTPRTAAILTGIVLGTSVLAATPALATPKAPAATSGLVRPTTPGAVVAPATVVSRLSLAGGALAGGEKLMIVGTKLATSSVVDDETVWTAKTVKFGSVTVDADDVEVLAEGALEVTVPAGSESALAVTVLVGDATKGPKYTYVSPNPVVTTDQEDLDEDAPASDNGLAAQVIEGSGFKATTQVVVGGTKAKATVTATKITFDYPAGLTGIQDVVVSDPRLSTYVGHVTYAAKQPTISAKSVEYAAVEGPTTVTLTGTNLTAVTAVTYGTEKATFAKTADATKLVVTVAKGAAGTADLKVATAYGKTATVSLQRKATPQPAVTAVSGVVLTGGVATITGTDLGGLKSVKLTDTNKKTYTATAITDNTATSAKVKLPALPNNMTYAVVVTTLSVKPSDAFSFKVGVSKPTVTAAASTDEGVTIALTGTDLKGLTKVVFTPKTGAAVTVTTGIASAEDGKSATVKPAKALTLGDWTVVATNGAGASTSAAFKVEEAAEVGAPTITSATYISAADSASGHAEVAIEGTNLAEDTVVRIYLEGDDPETFGDEIMLDVDTQVIDFSGDRPAGVYHVAVAKDDVMDPVWSDEVTFEIPEA